MISRARYNELKRDRPYLRHRRRQRQAESDRVSARISRLHEERERRRALDFKLKAIPAIVGAAVTAIVQAERKAKARQRDWALFNTLWTINRARGQND